MLKPFHARELLARANVHSRLRRLIRETAAQERRAMLGTLAASVAHQVRNPLTAIVSGLPLIKADLSEKSPPRAGKLIDVMIDSASRIERLTADLLEVSHIDRADEVEFAPGSTLLACARLLAPAMQATEVRLHTEVDLARHVRGRPADVGQACLNLLDNALRAVPRGGEIEILGRADDADYVIQVGDSGPGVAQLQRARIFEPFGTEGLSHQGTGLGLAIVRQIAVQHGGKIALLESKLGGALFELRLPLLTSIP
jgi:two-component system sensor histidine kinase HydH